MEPRDKFYPMRWKQKNVHWSLLDQECNCKSETLTLHCPIWQPPAKCGYRALEMWLVQTEMCYKHKILMGKL